MNESQPGKKTGKEEEFARQVGEKARRKLHARRNPAHGVWFGLGMMGIIGWSVSVPALLGAGLGIWLDSRRGDARSWTLALLVAGLCIGCMNAWFWVSRERNAMEEEERNDGN